MSEFEKELLESVAVEEDFKEVGTKKINRLSKRSSLRLDTNSIQESIQALEKGNLNNSDSDTIISMSRQISAMAKEIETLKIQLFQMSNEIKVIKPRLIF